VLFSLFYFCFVFLFLFLFASLSPHTFSLLSFFSLLSHFSSPTRLRSSSPIFLVIFALRLTLQWHYAINITVDLLSSVHLSMSSSVTLEGTFFRHSSPSFTSHPYNKHILTV